MKNTETKVADGDSTGSPRRSRSIVAAGLALGLVAGAGAGLAAGWPFAAGASTQSGASGTTQDAGDHGDALMAHDEEAAPAEFVRTVLQSLVDDGTLTQGQVEAILGALKEAHDDSTDGPLKDGEGHRGRDAKDRRPGRELLAAAAAFLGLDAGELRAELKSDKTLAEIAEARGKSRQELIDALVTAGIDSATERLNEMVPRLVDGEIGPRHDS